MTDTLHDKPQGVKIVGALVGASVAVKREGVSKEILSKDVEDDPEIPGVIAAISKALEAANLANKRHKEVVLEIKALEMREKFVKQELVTAQTTIVQLKGKSTASENELNKAKDELVNCKAKLDEQNKKLEKLKELEELVDKQKDEIEAKTKATEKEAKRAKRRKLVTNDLIEKLKNDAYNLEVKHKKEFDAKVEELDDLRAQFKALEISLKKQEAETSLRTTEKNELNAGLIKAKKSIKNQKVEISKLQSKIKIKDNEISEEAKAVKVLEGDLAKTEKEAKATIKEAKATIKEAMKKVSAAEQEAALAEKKRSVLDEKYKSAKKAMKKMQEDGTQACVNPEPQNQPILAGKAKEPEEFMGYWIQGMGEALMHPHDFKKINGVWVDKTPLEKLKMFARMEGRFRGIRMELIELEKKKMWNIDRTNENSSILKAQAEAAKGGRAAKYITGNDPMWAKLYGKTLTFQKDQGELKKIYRENKSIGKEDVKKGAKLIAPKVNGLLDNITLKF